MLVNTIRKVRVFLNIHDLGDSSSQDLESAKEHRICVALDALIQLPMEDVVPAVHLRLEDLLSHNS